MARSGFSKLKECHDKYTATQCMKMEYQMSHIYLVSLTAGIFSLMLAYPYDLRKANSSLFLTALTVNDAIPLWQFWGCLLYL